MARTKIIEEKAELFIRSNYAELTPSEISKKLKIPYSNIYNFMIKNNLPILCERSKKDKLPKSENTSGWFNPDEYENWLI